MSYHIFEICHIYEGFINYPLCRHLAVHSGTLHGHVRLTDFYRGAIRSKFKYDN
jgi:hypothetical protein